MRKIATFLVLSTALATGAYMGLKDVCQPICDVDRWQETVTIPKIYVDENGDGHFGKEELKRNYKVQREELALITFKDFGSRYIWIYPEKASKPKYQLKGRDVGLGKFTRLYLAPDLQSCCYLEKGASRRKNEKQRPGNNPQLQKTMIRFDLIKKSKINSSGELELVTHKQGNFVIQKDKAKKESARIMQYNLCKCSAD